MTTTTRYPHPATASRLRRTLAVAIVAVLCAGSALAAERDSTGSPVPIAHATRLGPGDAVIGALPLEQPIHVEVALKLRNKDALDAFIANSASSRTAPHLMSSAQLLADHAPSEAQARKVVDYLAAKGYTHVTIAPNRLLVSADGTAATARDAFATTFAQVRTADGRIAYANTDGARIPAALADTVLAVVGLQNVHQFHAFAQRSPAGAAHTDAMQSHALSEFTSIYGGTPGAIAPLTVGIVADGNLTKTIQNLAAYEAAIGSNSVTHQVVHVNEFGSDTVWTDEWSLDSQVIAAMLGRDNPLHLVFYDMPNLLNYNVTAAMNAIVAANKTKIIVASVGECEADAVADGSAAADDTILEAAVAQGQTFSIPGGSSGANVCGDATNAPYWPASSQYVVAVGGTNLHGPANTWGYEQAWQDSGGGPSQMEPEPKWQTALGVPGTTRGVPDVAFDGNPVSGTTIYYDTLQIGMGGNSLSASIFVGLWGHVLATWGAGAGFAAPVLYALPAGDFHDIVIGNNHDYSAGAGYDFTSGRGSMKIDKTVADSQSLVNQRPVASFTLATTGPSSVTVTDTSTDSDGTVVAHHWSFGDGTTATTATASHTYAAAGTYSIVDKVTDNDGATASVTHKFVASATSLTER